MTIFSHKYISFPNKKEFESKIQKSFTKNKELINTIKVSIRAKKGLFNVKNKNENI